MHYIFDLISEFFKWNTFRAFYNGTLLDHLKVGFWRQHSGFNYKVIWISCRIKKWLKQAFPGKRRRSRSTLDTKNSPQLCLSMCLAHVLEATPTVGTARLQFILYNFLEGARNELISFLKFGAVYFLVTYYFHCDLFLKIFQGSYFFYPVKKIPQVSTCSVDFLKKGFGF